MPRFKITTKQRTLFDGIYIEPGITMEIVTPSSAISFLVDGGKSVFDAFV